MADEEVVGIRWVQQELLSSLGIEDFDSLGLGSWDFSAEPSGVDGIIGLGEGEDFEEEVDKEIKREDTSSGAYGLTKSSRAGSLKRLRFGAEGEHARPRKKRKVVRQDPEAPRTIKDVWPAFERGVPLNFTQMLRYKVERKPRTHYRPLPTGECIYDSIRCSINLFHVFCLFQKKMAFTLLRDPSDVACRKS